MFYRIDYPEIADRYYFTGYGRSEKIAGEADDIEAERVRKALDSFRSAGVFPDRSYDNDRFLALRTAVKANYHILWTSITPPMERLIYSINAVKRPKNVLCLGVFCGNTVTWNVGAASGPGKCYDAQRLTGVEIEKEPAELAKKNLASIGMDDVTLLIEDGFKTIDDVDYPIDLLYLDANGFDPETQTPGTKRIYYSMLKKALPKLAPDAVILAHDTIIPSFTDQAQVYLDFVRDSRNFRASFSVEIDEEGIEVTFK